MAAAYCGITKICRSGELCGDGDSIHLAIVKTVLSLLLDVLW